MNSSVSYSSWPSIPASAPSSPWCWRRLPQQVHAGGAAVCGDRLDPQSRQVERDGRCVLEGQHHLEDGVAGERARRVDRLDHLLERHFLVGEGIEVGGPDPLQQFGERRRSAEVGAQHHRVDEAADGVVQPLVMAPGHRGSDGDVSAGTEP
ncbi:hypothetical protein RB199_32035 [Streptomyces libani]